MDTVLLLRMTGEPQTPRDGGRITRDALPGASGWRKTPTIGVDAAFRLIWLMASRCQPLALSDWIG
jgi:hypothetical protein